MVKKPEIGRVKTRLGRDIGPVDATRFYRAASNAVIRRLARDGRWRTVLSVAPDPAIATPAFPVSPRRVRQGSGDLGDRLARLFRNMPPGPVLIIGTDIPGITPQNIASALRQVRERGAAFGPAPDGGYWLIGFRRSPRRIAPFANVRWSSEHALADTAANLPLNMRERVLRQPQLPVLDDVDDGATHLRVREWAGRVVLPAASR